MTRLRAFPPRLNSPAAALGLCLLVSWGHCAAATAAPVRAPVCRSAADAQRRSGPACPEPHRALDVGGLVGSSGGALGGAAGGLGGTASGLGGTASPLGSVGPGVGGLASSAATGLVLSGLGSWVSDGASFVLRETADVFNQTTAPHLASTWFSSTYWKVAGIATVLTLPFLFAASVQALLRSDITLLLRSAFGYLPLAMLIVAIAAPVTMLLLSASDELAAAVSSAAGGQGANFFTQAVASLGTVGGVSGSPFVAFLLGIFTVAGALFLWAELLMREAAVYVVVLMLPLAFAAFVWPARRIWAIRSIEVLAALILSKFAIVAVLSLGAAALGNSVHGGLPGLLAGIVLLILGAFTPWALLRLLPLAEVASSTAGALRGQAEMALRSLPGPDPQDSEVARWMRTTARMWHAGGDPAAAGTQPQTPDAEPAAPPTAAAEGAAAMSASPSEGSNANDPSPEPAAPEPRTAAADPAVERVQSIDHLPDTGRYPTDESGT